MGPRCAGSFASHLSIASGCKRSEMKNCDSEYSLSRCATSDPTREHQSMPPILCPRMPPGTTRCRRHTSRAISSSRFTSIKTPQCTSFPIKSRLPGQRLAGEPGGGPVPGGIGKLASGAWTSRAGRTRAGASRTTWNWSLPSHAVRYRNGQELHTVRRETGH